MRHCRLPRSGLSEFGPTGGGRRSTGEGSEAT
jgi:hypothetical protein